jgi:hypothetical protein
VLRQDSRGLRRSMWVLEVLAWVVWVRIAAKASCLSHAFLLPSRVVVFSGFP